MRWQNMVCYGAVELDSVEWSPGMAKFSNAAQG